MTSADPTIRRIVVALEPSAHGRAALAAAVRIAARLEAELVGLYVEDPELLRLASFPFARAFSTSRASGRALSTETMTHALRAEARQVRESLARAAAEHHLRWSFDVRRGEIASELVSAVAAGDLLVVGRTRKDAPKRPPVGSTVRGVVSCCTQSVLVVPGGAGADGPVVVVYEDSAAGRIVLGMGAALARAEDRELLVLVPDESIRDEAEAALAATGRTGRVELAPREAIPSVLADLARAGRPTLVLGRSTATDPILDEMVCPIVVVG